MKTQKNYLWLAVKSNIAKITMSCSLTHERGKNPEKSLLDDEAFSQMIFFTNTSE
jgi:hypothetical protein